MVSGHEPLRPDRVAGMNLIYVFHPLTRFFDAMVDLEVDAVELWGGSPHLFADDVTAADVARIRRELERRDLRLVCYTPEQCVYPYNWAAAEERLRDRSVRYLERSLEIAGELGAGLMLVTSGWGYAAEPAGVAWERSRQALARVAARGAACGVTLVLEPLQPVESNLVIDLASLRRMIDEVGSPSLAACLDTVAMAVAGEDIERSLDELGGLLRHIHLNDGDPAGHLVWGDGSLPLAEYLRAVGERGYAGHLTLEIAADGYRTDPDAAMRRGLQAVRTAIDRLT